MKKMYYIGFLVVLSFITGCVDSASNDSQKKVDKPNEYYDLVSLKSKDLANYLLEMETSDDPALDLDTVRTASDNNTKIIIAGDSWAVFPCLHKSMTKTIKLRAAKFSNDERCLRTSKLGIEAREWIGSSQDQRLKKYIAANKNIKYIYLSLGGNDLMSTWNKDFTFQQEELLFAETYAHIQNAISQYISLRPDIKIVLSGYDYPHFKDNHVIPMYNKIYKNMGKPSDLVINEGLERFTRRMSTVTDYKNIFYIHHLGLSQYYDGVPEKFFPAYVTQHPDLISPYHNPSVTGGNTQYPSSQKSMIDWLWFIYDAFHLSERNYDRVLLHTFDNVLSRL